MCKYLVWVRHLRTIPAPPQMALSWGLEKPNGAHFSGCMGIRCGLGVSWVAQSKNARL